MEALGLLESRIKSLVELVGKLKDENTRLRIENSRLIEESLHLSGVVSVLQSKMDSFEGAFSENNKNLDVLSQEKELTKMFVDDLIRSIDSLVEENQQ